MEHKHKYYILGLILGIFIPFVEHAATYESLEPVNIIEKVVLFGEKIWHYVFLYLVLINSLFVYVKKLRERLNPESRMMFLISGVASGFAAISIISATFNIFLKLS